MKYHEVSPSDGSKIQPYTTTSSNTGGFFHCLRLDQPLEVLGAGRYQSYVPHISSEVIRSSADVISDKFVVAM